MKKTKRIISIMLSAMILTSVVTTAPFSVSAAETEIAVFVDQTEENSYEQPEDSTEKSAEKTSVKDNESETTIVSNDEKNTTLSNNQQSKKNIEPVGATELFGDYEYSVSGQNATITKYNGNDVSVVVPCKINGYVVTSIGNLAFSGCSLIKDITLPESVTYLGYSFISGTQIQSITIPKSVTNVGADTHGDFGRAYGPLTGALQLKEVIFEDGMTKIPAYMCRTTYNDDWSSTINNIDTILMPDSIETIGDYAFYNCDKITSVTMPKALKAIGQAAYYDCDNISSLKFTYNSVTKTEIGQNTFGSCDKLSSINLSENITSIGNLAFSGCSLIKDITLPESVTYLGYSFISGTQIQSITIPKSVTNVGADTHGDFGQAYGPLTGALQLKEVIFEDGMTKIPAYMCRTTYNDDWSSTINNIDTILMPDSIETIGDYAFYNCDKITSVTMPKALKAIGQAAYYDCDNISSLKFTYNSVTKTEIGQNTFGSCDKLSSINLSENITSIGNLAFSGCSLIKDITLPESVTYLGYSFISGTQIQSITIPKSVTNVGADTHGDFGRAYGPLTGALQLKEVIFEDGMTKIPAYMCRTTYNDDWSSSTINNIDTILMPDSIETIGDYAFYNCDKITSVTMPKALKTIGRAAYYDCSNLNSVSILMTVTSIYSNAFSNCNKLTIYGYENSYAEDYALNNGIPFVAIADEDTFIQKHLEFIGAENSNNTYHNQIQHFDLAEIALEDYGDLNDMYNLWRTVRGEILDNPYYTVLSDMILSESAVQGQMESFDIHLDSEWRSVANDIIELINSKVDLTPSQESKIKKMFKKGDFTDETTFKFCQDVLGNKVSKDELNSIFNVYDKTNTFLDVFNQGADIVESVYDTMNYSAILKAYEKTSDEFKVVLMQMAYTCQTENPWLYTAIDKYLKSDYDTEMRNKIVEEVAKNGLSIGKTLFKSSIENKVKAFIINNMDLSKIGTSVATKVLAFVEGCKIGYAIGTGIDNLLFSTDDVSNSFVAASATAKTAGYLKYVLETNESNLRNNPTIKNAVLFCETYNMYKNIQLNTADTMIKYFSKNQTSLINRIFQSNNVLYEHQIYNWQMHKLNWQNASCHKGYILNSKLKNVTVACPVDVTVYTNTGEIALQITDSVVEKNNGDVIATVCNNIKYITLPDDSYSIKITATESGKMTYSITEYNSFDNSSKTICFNNIPITKDNEYTGNIASGSDYSQSDISLYSNNATVESEVSEFTNESIIEVNSINLSSNTLYLKAEETKTLSAIVEPSNASIKTVSWYSDDSKIAQVDEYGNVSGISVGTTKIYCVSLEGNVVAECEVMVESRYDIGDTNLDGSITISDVTEIQKHLAELIHFSDEQLVLADTNGDSIVNITDATHLQKYLAEFDGIVLGKS